MNKPKLHNVVRLESAFPSLPCRSLGYDNILELIGWHWSIILNLLCRSFARGLRRSRMGNPPQIRNARKGKRRARGQLEMLFEFTNDPLLYL
jgi:hypothetical protein